MKKCYALVIVLVITVFQLYSQKTKDVLYLKNGSVINGTIFEISDNQIKIRAIDRNIFVFKTDEVDKYIKQAIGYEGRKKSGFGLALESGFLLGSQNSNPSLPFSFDCLGSYTVSTSNIFGIGAGVEFFEQSYLPVFIEYKRLIFDRKTAPFLFLRGGSLLHGAKNDHDGSYNPNDQINIYKNGVLLTIGTGISWCSEYSETYLSFAYRYSAISRIQQDYSQAPVTYKNFYNRLEIKFGFKF